MGEGELKRGAILIARDGREFTFLEYDEDGYMLLKYGPGQDEVSWWGPDGRAEYDDPGFVSDADIVAVKENCLFDYEKEC